MSTDPASEHEALRLDQFLKLRGVADSGWTGEAVDPKW